MGCLACAGATRDASRAVSLAETRIAAVSRDISWSEAGGGGQGKGSDSADGKRRSKGRGDDLRRAGDSERERTDRSRKRGRAPG